MVLTVILGNQSSDIQKEITQAGIYFYKTAPELTLDMILCLRE
jgi:hypothetical protein